MSCEPSELAEQAKGFQGLDEVQARSIELYLLATIAGVPPVPEDLLAAAKDFIPLNAQQAAAVQTYLLCQIQQNGV
jgi:hypothetical protein